MTEERVTSQIDPSSEVGRPPSIEAATPAGQIQPDTDQPSEDERRAKVIKRILYIGAFFGIVDILFYLVLFFQIRDPQLLLAFSGIPISLGCLIVAHRMTSRQELDKAGYWMLAAIVIAFGVGELNTSGTAISNAMSGVLLIILIGNLILARKTSIWVLTAIAYLAIIALINRFEPVPRFEITAESPVVFVFVPAIAFLLTLVVLLQVVRALRMSAIQTRLMLAFAALSLLLTFTVSVISAAKIYQSGQEQLYAQLESVAALKEAEIDSWVDTLMGDLAALLADDTAMQQTTILLQGYRESGSFVYIRDALTRRFSRPVDQTQRFEEVFLLNIEGTVIFSTDPDALDESFYGWTFFHEGLRETGSHLILDWQEPWVSIVLPVFDNNNQVLGVLAGRANLETLNEIMLERTGMGETGETYLLSSRQGLITELISGESPIYVRSDAADLAAEERVSGYGIYDNYAGVPVIGVYRWLPELQIVLMAEQARAEALSATFETLGINVGVALASLVLAVVASLFVTRSIVTPLANLSETVEQIAAGDLERFAVVEREDEIGNLARAFNSLTAQLRGLIGNLELRVAERTATIERRSIQLEAAAQVARGAAEIRDIAVLLDRVVHLISDRFGFYHAGLFLMDDQEEYLVLRAASSEGGQRMLDRRHSLRVGSGIVGTAAATAEPHIALDVGADATFFNNPDLPETRSEMGLPLKVHDHIIGVLDVQSTQEAAFSEDDVAILQTMADQLSLAIESARLLSESQRALRELENLYGARVLETWRDRAARQASAYIYDRISVVPADQDNSDSFETSTASEPVIVTDENGHQLISPIRLRGQVLGTVVLRRTPQQEPWSSEEVALAQEASAQVALALENAQLLEESQRHSERDRLIANITARVRSSMHVETILQTAIQELGAALGTDRASVHLTGVPQVSIEDGDGDGQKSEDLS